MPEWLYVCMTLAVAVTSGWVLVEGLAVPSGEVAVKGWYMDCLPVRFRRYVGAAARWSGQYLPYLYITFKHKCFKGPPDSPHTCDLPGHSCVRKIVSYFRIYGRRKHRTIHRAAQVGLQQLKTWECWSLKDAPKQLRERYDGLIYTEANRHVCVFCGGRKKAVTCRVKDASQAYEQTLPGEAIFALA